MQISIKSDTEINENTSMSNYNNRTMWTRMMSDDDMLATSFMTEHDQKSSINKQKNRIEIICTIMRQK